MNNLSKRLLGITISLVALPTLCYADKSVELTTESWITIIVVLGVMAGLFYYSMSNVEIVDWGVMGSLAYSHAKVVLRNKNNYDVDVYVSLYQGKWGAGSITYGQYENSDRISDVSDEFSERIRVKANAMRTVYLRGKSRGKPNYIQISSVR